MDRWLNVSMVDIDHLIPVARAAEESGFAGLSMGDHLVFPQQIASPYPYSADGAVKWTAEAHWPDAWVAIAAMAAATRTLRFVTGVYVAPLRDPFALAKAMSTAARFSGDRVIGGFGAGWMREEFALVGAPFEARGARMDELIEVMRRLWTGRMVDFHGRFYDFPPVQMTPPPLRPIPIYVGGHNAAALRRAARNDGWIGVHKTLEETGALIARIRALQQDAPQPRECSIMLNIRRDSAEDVARFAELGVRALVLPALGLPGEPGLQGRLDAIRRAGDALRA